MTIIPTPVTSEGKRGLTQRSAVPVSPAFDCISRGAQFRDRVAIVVKASPKAIRRMNGQF